MPQNDHPLVYIQPLIFSGMPDVQGCERPPVVVLPVLFQLNHLPVDYLHKAIPRDIAPILSVFRAIYGIEPDIESAPSHSDDGRIAIHDEFNSSTGEFGDFVS